MNPMQMSFNIDMPNIQQMQEVTVEQQKWVLWRSMHKMEEIAKRLVPVDTGFLKRSIKLNPIAYGAKEYKLVCGASYGVDLEFGNTPREVKLAPLIKWVERKGIKSGDAVYPFAKYVQGKIATKGVNAHPFFRPAKSQVQHIYLPKFWKEAMG